MGGYLVNFTIYLMAMLGLIFFALLIYQKASKTGVLGARKSTFLGIEDSLSIGARKNLYVIRAGNERFLIAGDMDKTSLIAKLGENENITAQQPQQFEPKIQKYTQPAPQPAVKKTNTVNSVEDLPVIVDFQQRKNGNQKKVMQNMLKKINE